MENVIASKLCRKWTVSNLQYCMSNNIVFRPWMFTYIIYLCNMMTRGLIFFFCHVIVATLCWVWWLMWCSHISLVHFITFNKLMFSILFWSWMASTDRFASLTTRLFCINVVILLYYRWRQINPSRVVEAPSDAIGARRTASAMCFRRYLTPT